MMSIVSDATLSAHDDLPSCAGGESFALMVMGHSMAPEFLEGEIIIIEPDGLAQDGSYVLAWSQDEWTFRQLQRAGDGWLLHPLNPTFPEVALPSLTDVRGVIIQKALPGRRRASKHYV
jgi:SOS-response transcriptional repressor LexA